VADVKKLDTVRSHALGVGLLGQPWGRAEVQAAFVGRRLKLIFAGISTADAPGVPFDLSQCGVERGVRLLLYASHSFRGVDLFRVINRYVGNLAPMPGVFPARRKRRSRGRTREDR
jgi:hypothetical protein